MPSQAGGGAWPDISADAASISRLFTFTAVAGSGAIGAVPLFTIAGPQSVNAIEVIRAGGLIETNCAGASGTLAYGVTGNTGVFIAATAVANLVTTTPVWVSTTPTAGALAMPSGAGPVMICANIIAQVATTDFSAGAIRFFVTYRAMTPGAFLKLS